MSLSFESPVNPDYIEALRSGIMHFGEIPEQERQAIMLQAQREVNDARMNFPKLDGTNPLDMRVQNELAGQATQALLLGNLKGIKFATAKVRTPNEAFDEVVSHADLVQDVAERMGAYASAYDPLRPINPFGYIVRRAFGTARTGVRGRGHNHSTYAISKRLEEVEASKWGPLTTQDYKDASVHLSTSRRIDDNARGVDPAELVDVVKETYIFSKTEPLPEGFDCVDPTSMQPYEEIDETVTDQGIAELNWSGLSPALKETVDVYFFGDKEVTYEEAGAVLGITRQAVHQRIQKALKILRGAPLEDKLV